MSQDIVKAARRFIAQQDGIASVLSSDAHWDLYLFQERLMVRIESSQNIACVLLQKGNWTSPNNHNTLKFPRLIVEFWADPDRDSRSNVTLPLSAKDKILAAYEFLDKYLHRVAGGDLWWPDQDDSGAVRVISSKRSDELSFYEVPDGDGMMRAQVIYNIVMG